VQRIVRAYDSYGRAQQQLPLELGEGISAGLETPADAGIQLVSKPQ
jgi:phosphate starvation-inducible PhoH-like protein